MPINLNLHIVVLFPKKERELETIGVSDIPNQTNMEKICSISLREWLRIVIVLKWIWLRGLTFRGSYLPILLLEEQDPEWVHICWNI